MNIVVIGASAAGLKAACRARRLMPKAKIKVVDKSKFISYSACGLPYFLSGDIDSFLELNKTAYDVVKDIDYFRQTKDVEILAQTEALKIDSSHKIVHCRTLTGKTLSLPYDKLLIATGAEPVIPTIAGHNLPGVCAFNKAEDAIKLRKALQSGEIAKAAIIGAGFIGCELCEAFTAMWGVEVELFEILRLPLTKMLDEELGTIALREITNNGVETHFNCRIEKIDLEGDKLSIHTGRQSFKGFDRVIFAAGVKPSVQLALAAGVEIGWSGGIKVDRHLHTNIPDIFAAGDCVEVTHILTGQPLHLPLGSLANRMGRTAGNNLAGGKDTFGPVAGAACLKLYDISLASVGLTAVAAREAGFQPGESWGVFTDRAHFYPEAQLYSAKMVYNIPSRQILGLQAAGKGDIIRRIDAASNMIKDGLTLERLLEFEPAYAPPFANALDPIHFLAYAAIASLDEGIESFNPLQLEKRSQEAVVIDVREEAEISEMPLNCPSQQFLTISLTQLRRRLSEIPQEGKIVVVCQRGTRAAEAVRILQEKGFKEVSYLGGGWGFFL